jgi:hypothetical protein
MAPVLVKKNLTLLAQLTQAQRVAAQQSFAAA